MKDLRESMVLLLLQLAAGAILAVALAITAIAQAMPWVILAGAVGICLIIGTSTACYIKLRESQQPKLPPPPQIHIIGRDPGETLIELPRQNYKQLPRGKK